MLVEQWPADWSTLSPPLPCRVWLTVRPSEDHISQPWHHGAEGRSPSSLPTRWEPQPPVSQLLHLGNSSHGPYSGLPLPFVFDICGYFSKAHSLHYA